MANHRPATLARNGIVCAPHYLAAQAGLRLLQAGGNAVDAAIAASAALNVVYPILCGTGGDLFMLIWDAATASLHALDAAGRSGSLASIERVCAAGHTAMPQRGAMAVSVPGVVDGWAMASERFGRLGLVRALQPAIAYAEDGAPATPYLAERLAFVAQQPWAHQSWRDVYAPGGKAPAAGALLRVPELGRTLRLVAERGRDVFYEGEIAAATAGFLQREGGFLTREDLAAHRGRWVEPLAIDYHGYTIYEMPPPTQGVTALQALKLAEGLALGDGPLDAETVHLLVEAKKLAFADRAACLADPDCMRVAPRALLDEAYLDTRRRQIDPQRAAASPAGISAGDTIYLCAADGEGNAVSLIQSNYMGVGSGLVVPGYGVELHNRGCSFSLDPAHPNALGPRRQPLHTLIPSMAFKNGRPAIVFGTMGGDGQPQTHLQVYTALIAFGMIDDPQAAIELPRWVHGRGLPGDPPELVLEGRFPRQTAARLRELGHEVSLTEDWSSMVGHAHAITIDQATGVLRGAADPRADSLAAAW